MFPSNLHRIALALLQAAALRALTSLLPKPPEAPPMTPADLLTLRLLARLWRAPNPVALETFRSDTEAGLWNRWYEGEEPTMDAPVGGLLWARRLSYEQVAGLVERVREEYGA